VLQVQVGAPGTSGNLLTSDGTTWKSEPPPPAGGKVLQVVSVTKTDTGSFASANTNNYADIPGMSVTITPTSATSKVLVMYTVAVSQSTSATIHVRLLRGATSIGQGAASGNRLGDSLVWRPNDTQYAFDIGPLSSSFLDSPNTTSATTYKLVGTLGSTYNGTFFINRAKSDDSFDYAGRTASTITVMEISA
jgi:hypothetical protein